MERQRVAAYCRVSTCRTEQRASIDAQARYFEELIAKNPDWELAGVYVDFGKSGTRMANRPALQKLLGEARRGRIDRILAKSISRFSRNAEECLDVVREFRARGIAICFEKEQINTLTMGTELLLSVFASFAQEESRQIADNCMWGIRERFRQGTYLPPVLPYGYRREEGKVVTDPQSAPVVRSIFTAAARGASPPEIRNMLNDQGVPAPRGGAWATSTIRHMLANPFYKGDLLLQKSYRDDRHIQLPNKGKLEQYLVRGHHEALAGTYGKTDYPEAEKSPDLL